MKIAIIGYGKMGQLIESLAIQAGHQVVLKTNETPTHTALVDSKTEVAIEFTRPESAYNNVLQLLKSDIPVVCGTTGWTEHLIDIQEKVEQYNGSFIYASNFSLGVNLFFAMVQNAAKLMRNHPLYQSFIEEIHHTEKKDAPSGTAITIAEKMILESNERFWELSESKERKEKTIPIKAVREENVPGTHTVQYVSEIDAIELKHTAFSREGFALGALKAAEYIHDKKGIFTMKDVLGL